MGSFAPTNGTSTQRLSRINGSLKRSRFSFVTRYQQWQSGTRKRRDEKPQTLNPKARCYPVLYKGQCYKLHGENQATVKVCTGRDWVWTTVAITCRGKRHRVETNQRLSPSLMTDGKRWHLSVLFECSPEQRQPNTNVVGVDLGLNTTATVSVVTFDGTVIHRAFIHLERDIDRRDKPLKSVSTRAKKTMGKGGKLHKRFCSQTYWKCCQINRHIAHHVSKRIVAIPQQFNAQAIVFEHLKAWRPKGGKRGSTLRQRFHGWLKAMIRHFTAMKWQEVGGQTVDVVAAYLKSAAVLVKRQTTSGRNYSISAC
ncbi:MAG: hypothetical protein ACK4IR_12235, partial [Thermosynechococcus sp.]